jgi:GT2 family glycosyltransferase
VALSTQLSDVAAVAIGKDEGERLRRCLASLGPQVSRIVYVDSGSKDGSAAHARSLGCEVVELDPAVPFTAARARNAGLARLRGVPFVQLVDGDCELAPGWIELARARLSRRPELAVVCGRRRERDTQASVYHRLCDVEWDTPIGDAAACGGDALVRTSAIAEVGGFDPTVIAGEEPELCVRLRRAGYAIERVDAEMTLHDAAMSRFGAWWKRARRCGHAYAEGAAKHGQLGHCVREVRRTLFWGAALPAVAIAAAPPTFGASLALLGGYGVSAARAYREARSRGRSHQDALPYALFATLGKFAETQGVLDYHLARLRGQRRGVLDYE